MIIRFGSTATLVPRHVDQDDPEFLLGATKYDRLDGEQTLELRVPDDKAPRELLLDIVAAVTHHIEAGADGNIRPAWIECPDPDLLGLLCTHYGLNKKQATRPKRWGTIAPSEESAP